MASPPSSPTSPKRMRISAAPAQGVCFQLSPQVISKRKALHVDLRSISAHSLTIAEAECEQAGYVLCMSPAATSSNKRYAELLSTEQEFHLYCTLLGSSPRVCEVDLVTFVLRHLDYFLKQIVRNEMEKGGTEFEDALIGSHKERPFQRTDGNNIRYGALLLFVDRMHSNSPLEYAAYARMSIYEDLLDRCEDSLISCLRASGASYARVEEEALLRHMRAELLDFLTGHIKGDRDIASHIFCNLLWVDNRSPLEDLDLQDPFPALKHDAFAISKPSRLQDMALKVLVFKDLEARYGLNRIGKFTHEVTKAALKLVPSCIERNVAVSRKVICGAMEATIPGIQDGGDLDPVELDPPPSMTHLLRS